LNGAWSSRDSAITSKDLGLLTLPAVPYGPYHAFSKSYALIWLVLRKVQNALEKSSNFVAGGQSTTGYSV
jgi:hypothetical protein